MPDLTLNAAKEVVAKAIEFDAWAWEDPDSVTDDTVLATAQNLIQTAADYSKNGSVADAVLEILFASQIEPLSEPSREAYTRRFGAQATANGGASAPTPLEAAAALTPEETARADALAAAAGVERKPETAAAPAGDISDIFPGYDDLKVADIKKAILDSTASGDLSEGEWKRIKAYEAAHEERKTILSLVPQFKAPEPEPTPEPESLPQQTASNDPTGFTTSGTAAPTTGADNVDAFYKGDSPSRAQQEGLPIPGQVEFSQQPPMLPIDITTVSDQELSRIATMFHSCFARAQWLQSQEEGRERAAEHLERESERDAYVSAYEKHRSAIPEDKQHQPTALEAARKAAEKDAESAQKVREFRSAKVRHGVDARELRALAGGYDKAVFRIKDELDRRLYLVRSSASVK